MRRLIMTLALSALALSQAQTVTVAISEGIPGFDPTQTTRSVANNVYPNIFDTLINLDRSGDLAPSLATSWIPESDTTWRITLRDDVTWHDGTPFTADDVKFTLERLATTPDLIRHVLMADVISVDVESPTEVVVHMTDPDPLFPSNLADAALSMLPEHYFTANDADTVTQNPIGTGPYKFVEYRPDDRLILKAYDAYWQGQPEYSDLEFRVITENTTAVSELITGGVQLAQISANDLERVESSSDTRVSTQSTNRAVHWTFNVSEDQATSDPLVRRAIDYAIDNQIFIDVLEQGYGTPTRARTGPGDALLPEKYYDTYNYDPERAVELLEEAGYGPGELTIVLGGSSAASDRAELTAAMLEAVGINADIQLYESSVWSSRYWTPGEFMNMAAVGSSNATKDYGSTLTDLMCPEGAHSQRSHWCHEEFSDLVRTANSELDEEVRGQLLSEAADILVEELPQVYLYNSVNFMGIANSLDWEPRPDGSLLMFDAKPAN